jgi:hypothetical protein
VKRDRVAHGPQRIATHAVLAQFAITPAAERIAVGSART